MAENGRESEPGMVKAGGFRVRQITPEQQAQKAAELHKPCRCPSVMGSKLVGVGGIAEIKAPSDCGRGLFF